MNRPRAIAPRPRGLLPAALLAVGLALLCQFGYRSLALGLAGLAVWAWWRGGAAWTLWALPAALAPGPDPSLPTAAWSRPGPVWIEGRVRAPVDYDPVARVWLCRLEQHGQVFGLRLTGARGDRRPLPGDLLRGPARLPVQGLRQREGRMPWVQAEAAGLHWQSGGPGLQRWCTATRLALQEQLRARLPGTTGDLCCHLVLGRGPRLPEEVQQAHRDTGLAHLLAVSGAHLTMLAGILALGYQSLRRRSAEGSPRFRRLCIPLLWLYGLVTGMEPPVFRAVVAAWMFLYARSLGRRLPVAAVLALPALLTALWQPADLFRLGFQLSYAAVFGLSLAGAEDWDRGAAGWLRGSLRASFWATLCTSPLTCWHFGQIAPWTILCTPILGPWIAAMLALGLCCASLGLIANLPAELCAPPLAWMTETYLAALGLCQELPGTPIHSHARAAAETLLLAGLPGLLLLVYSGARLSWLRWGTLACCLGSTLPHFCSSPPPRLPGLQLLDVGHGQAALCHLDDGSRLLIDCGSLASPTRSARRVAEALLPARALDLLVVSHGDADHWSGIPRLATRVRIREAVLPTELEGSGLARLLADQGCRLQFLGPGSHLQWAAGLQLFRPLVAATSRNEQSIWARLRLGPHRVLFPADAGSAAITAALARPRRLRAEVLVLPHHGRSETELPALLAAVRPLLCLASCDPRDGVPAQAATLQAAGIPLWDTGRCGPIQLDAQGLRAAAAWPLPRARDQ